MSKTVFFKGKDIILHCRTFVIPVICIIFGAQIFRVDADRIDLNISVSKYSRRRYDRRRKYGLIFRVVG